MARKTIFAIAFTAFALSGCGLFGIGGEQPTPTRVVQVVAPTQTPLAVTSTPVQATQNVAPPAATAAPAANRGPDPACAKLTNDYKNRPHPENAKWMGCFLTGDINWVFSPEEPLPLDPPRDVRQALASGKFAKLVEPWRPGCDNTMTNPNCNIGYLKFFSDWGTMYAFTRVGETRPNVKGPWTMGSVWITPGPLVQMSPGIAATDEEKRLLCNGLVEWNFSENYPLPQTSPCSSGTLFTLREPFRGGCTGATDDQNCNVGFGKQFTSWSSLLAFLKDGNWPRGSVWGPRN